MTDEKAEWEQFYAAFEERFRGSSAAITERLAERYGSELQLIAQEQDGKALDLGCGHGEMLSVLADAGLTSIGVDASAAAVARSKHAGHDAIQADILAYLADVATDSLSVATYIHVIEHCPPPYSLAVVKECARVLKPGGLLIVETPSLFSLWAGHRQFYLDPTHERPVHPDYLAFMVSYCGFAQHRLVPYGEVEHPERPPTALSQDSQALQTVVTAWDRWLFGPMDMACLARR